MGPKIFMLRPVFGCIYGADAEMPSGKRHALGFMCEIRRTRAVRCFNPSYYLHSYDKGRQRGVRNRFRDAHQQQELVPG